MGDILGDGLSMGNVSENIGEASEEDLVKVRESLAKAAQIKSQLAQAQQQQGGYAQMLSLLLQYVQDGALLKGIFEQMHDHHIAIEYIFAQFYPGLTTREDLSWFTTAYPWLVYEALMGQQITPFVAYIRHVREQWNMTAIPMTTYVPFLITLVQWTGLVDMTGRDDEKRQSFAAWLHEHLT